MDSRNHNYQDDLISEMPWKKTDGYLFASKTILINAPPEQVWKKAIDIENYAAYSQNIINTKITGTPEKDKKFTMELYNDTLSGRFIPASTECISIVKEEDYVIGWEREIWGSGTTERYHKIKGVNNNEQSLSAIALRIRNPLGFFVNAALGNKIVRAFDALNNGIQEAVEAEEAQRRQSSKL